jgi:hypothetical protein
VAERLLRALTVLLVLGVAGLAFVVSFEAIAPSRSRRVRSRPRLAGARRCWSTPSGSCASPEAPRASTSWASTTTKWSPGSGAAGSTCSAGRRPSHGVDPRQGLGGDPSALPGPGSRRHRGSGQPRATRLGSLLSLGNSAAKFAGIDRYVHERLAIFASNKHGRRGRNWASRYDRRWLRGLGVHRFDRHGPLRDCACLTVNDVGKPCAGEPHARFDGGRWRSDQVDQPAAYPTTRHWLDDGRTAASAGRRAGNPHGQFSRRCAGRPRGGSGRPAGRARRWPAGRRSLPRRPGPRSSARGSGSRCRCR